MAGIDEESGPLNFSEDFTDDEDETEGEPSFQLNFHRAVFSGEAERGGKDFVTAKTPLDLLC